MKAVLEVKDVWKHFGGVVAVQGASLHAQGGAITAVIGPNGAGKTTLFNVVTGFDEPDRGSVILAGEEISGREPWAVAQMGMVRTFQTPVGFPALSVWENVMVAGSSAGEESVFSALGGRRTWSGRERTTHVRAHRLLEALGIWHLHDRRLEDMTPGDTKLVDFARQLMRRPRMLLLDEPAAGVDPAAIGKLAELIKTVSADGITVLVIDHNISFVLDVASYVYVMEQGRVIADGTPGDVVKDPRVIEIYLGSAG